MSGSARDAGSGLCSARPLSRPGLFFWLVVAAASNSFAAIAARTWAERGAAYAIFELFGINALVWVALAAALALLAAARDDACAPAAADWWIAASVAVAALIPIGTMSAVALTLLAAWMVATAPRHSPLSRAGIVCLAITGTLIWGRVLLALLSRPLLDWDAWMVGALFSARQAGNVIAFVDGSGRVVVAPGCSSWQGMSLALLCWVTVNQWFRVPLGRRAILTCAAALAATVAINVLRIGAMLVFPQYLASIHHGALWHVAVWTSLIAVVVLCVAGARREIFEG